MKTIKQTSRILGLALLLTLCLSLLAPSAFAIEESDKGTINVTSAEAGVTVNAYQIITVNYDFESDQPVSPVYAWNPALQDWIETNYDAYEDANNFNTETLKDAATIAAFYDDLAAAIKGSEVTLAPAGSGTAGEDGSATITGLDMGNYLVLIEGGMKVYKPSAVNLVPEFEEGAEGQKGTWTMTTPAAVQLKSSEPSLDKSINETTISDGHSSGKDEHSSAENGTKGKDNADIGDIVRFDLRADVPDYPANALAYTYAISDVLPTGLTLDSSSITVYASAGGAETPLTEGIHYNVATGANRPGTATQADFTVTFTESFLKNADYTKVHITYTATLNGDAVVGQLGNTNHAYLDYSNNPYDTSSYETKEDWTTVYTYGIDLSKRGGTEDGDLLSGAKFTISAVSGGTPTISMVKVDDGVYRVATNSDDTTVTELEVGAGDGVKGKLTIKGLDAGTYYLTETVAPGGYTLPSGAVEVVITDSNYDGAVEVGENGATTITTGLVPVTVVNTQGFSLPTTGGAGTMAFTAIGVVLMGAGLIVFLLGRRRKAQDEA